MPHRSKKSLLFRLILRVDNDDWYEKYSQKYSKVALDTFVERVTEESKAQDSSFSRSPSKKKSKKQNQKMVLKKCWECTERVAKGTQYEQPCGFFVFENCVYQTASFFAAGRGNKLPIVTLSPVRHINNDEWIHMIQLLHGYPRGILPSTQTC